MTLRAIKPSAIVKRLKLFLFGPAKIGKTTVAMQFPRPYFIDTERGAENKQYVEALEEAGGVYLFTANLEEIIAEVRALATERHSYRTLVIDPSNVPYNEACDRYAQTMTKGDPSVAIYGRHKVVPDRAMRRLAVLLRELDMNVVVTAHAKPIWEGDGKSLRETGAMTFDGYKRMEYDFDLILEAQQRGKEHVAVVRGSRVEGFPRGQVFPLSYMAILARWGEDVDHESKPIELATVPQVERMRLLIETLHVPEETVEKWFDKAGAEALEELPADVALKCILWMEAKVVTPVSREEAPVAR